jgi:hypothetical protein
MPGPGSRTRRRRHTRSRTHKQRGGGGSSAHGFEMPDGKVKYCLRGEEDGIVEAVELYDSKITLDKCKLAAESVDAFFNDESLYEKEDSAWRVLKMQDGSIKGKRWGLEGIFTYT